MRMKPTCNFSPTFMRTLSIDRIEYDVTIQISDLQHGVCERVHVCVHVPKKSNRECCMLIIDNNNNNNNKTCNAHISTLLGVQGAVKPKPTLSRI